MDAVTDTTAVAIRRFQDTIIVKMRETQIQLTGRVKIHVAEHGRIRFNLLCKNISIVLTA